MKRSLLEVAIPSSSSLFHDAPRTRAEALLEKKLKFERLLADVAADFVNSPRRAMADAVRRAQRRLCEFLALERSAVWQFSDLDLRLLQITHLYETPPPRTPSNCSDLEADTHLPWACHRIRRSKSVVLEGVDALPENAAVDREYLLRAGIKSIVLIPLRMDDAVIGFVTFETLSAEKKWSPGCINKLRAIGRIFSLAVARDRIDDAMSESEARLKRAADSANAGLWEFDAATATIRASAKAREMFGIGGDDKIPFEDFIKVIHHDDIQQFRRMLDMALDSEEPARADVRVASPDESFRWIDFSASRCRVTPPGVPVRIFGVAMDGTDRKQIEEDLQRRLAENAQLKKRLESENVFQREEFKTLRELTEIVGQSSRIQTVFRQIAQVAPTDSPVLITGETGTGKELVARAIHAASQRRNEAMVTVNCATLPAALIESELFGREKGAYTGALMRQLGRFELADGGTLFLDEIGELTVELQGKLLRVLQEGEFERLGNPKTIRVDVRLIAATNRNLADSVNNGSFRKDLYYRLSVFPIELPPLRDRADDIPLLVWAFIDEFNRKMGKRIISVPQKAMDWLTHCAWPGNVRELRNKIEHAMILSRGERLELALPEAAQLIEPGRLTLEQIMRQSILDALKKTGWRIKGPRGAAALLGLRPSTLYTKMKKLNIPLRVAADGMPS